MKEVLPVAEGTKALGRTLEAPVFETPVLPPIPGLEKKLKRGDYLKHYVWEVGPRRAEEAKRMRDVLQRRRMEEVMRRAERQLKEADARKARRASLLLDYWVERSLEEFRQRQEKEAKEKKKKEKGLRTRREERGEGGKPRDLMVSTMTVLSTPDTTIPPVSPWGPSLPSTPWRVRRSFQYPATSTVTTAAEDLEPSLNVHPTKVLPQGTTWPTHMSPGMVASPDPFTPWVEATPEAFRRLPVLPPVPSSSVPPDEDTPDLDQLMKVETIQDPSHQPLPDAPRRRPQTKLMSSSYFQGPKYAHPQLRQVYKPHPPGDVKATILDIGGKRKRKE